MTFSATFLAILIYGCLCLVAAAALILALLFLRDRKDGNLW